MKRILISALISIGILSLAAVPIETKAISHLATNDSNRGTVKIAQGETKDGSYYAAGSKVLISGTVNGDVYCAGQEIQINGTVNGDVMCAGERVTIDGTVTGDVRTAGRVVDVSGKIGRTLTAFSQDVVINKDAVIADDLNGAAQYVKVNGAVERDVVIATQTLTVNGLVKGDVHTAAQTVELMNTPSIEGKLYYTSEKESSIEADKVRGGVDFQRVNRANDRAAANSIKNAFSVFAVLFAIGTILSAIALVALMPRFYERAFSITHRRLGRAVLLGFAVVCGLPMLSALLLLTGVLMPLGLLVGAVWFVICSLSFSFAAYCIGRWIFADAVRHSLLVMLVGAVILVVALHIPLLGLFVFLAMLILGSGALVSALGDGYRKPNYRLPVRANQTKK